MMRSVDALDDLAPLDRGKSVPWSAVAGARKWSVLVRSALAALLNVDQEWAAAAVPVAAVLFTVVSVERGALHLTSAPVKSRSA